MAFLQPFLTIGLAHYLVLGALVFAFGVTCVVTRKNAIGVLMGVELILNAANINLVAFAHYVTGAIDGQVLSLFIIILAAAEAAVALAIVLALYATARSIDVTETTTLQR